MPRRRVDPERLKGAIYGTILVVSLVAAMGQDPSFSAWDMTFWVVVTNAVFWLAHVYASLVALYFERGRRPGLRDVARQMRQQWPIVNAVALPALALVLAGAHLWSRGVGVNIAIAVGVASLFAWGVMVGRRAGLGLAGVLTSAVLSLAFGLVIVALEVAID